MVESARTSHAFTLTELLVVIGIITIITGGFIPAFSKYIGSQDLKQAQEQLKSDLRSVQNRAISGASSSSLVGGNPVEHWGIQFQANQSGYNFFVSDDDTSTCLPPNNTPKGKYVLPSDMIIRSSSFSSGTSGCVFFRIKDGGVVTRNMSTHIIVSKSASDTVCKRVTYNSAGLIFSTNDVLCT